MYQCLVEYQESRLNELVASFGDGDEHKCVSHLRATIAAATDHSPVASKKEFTTVMSSGSAITQRLKHCFTSSMMTLHKPY